MLTYFFRGTHTVMDDFQPSDFCRLGLIFGSWLGFGLGLWLELWLGLGSVWCYVQGKVGIRVRTSHFGSGSGSPGRLAAASECMASIYTTDLM